MPMSPSTLSVLALVAIPWATPELGADDTAHDLVMSRDGQLIARHEPMAGGTTNTASAFGPERMATQMVDGVSTTDCFASNFALAETTTLRAIQPSPTRAQEFNGLHETPALEEIISLAHA